MNRRHAAQALALAAASFARATWADSFPSKPVKIVVPLTAGGLTDISVRILAEQMKNSLTQPLLVDNKPGASGSIAARLVARADPDGYTLLAVTTSHTAVVPFVQPQVGYDPLKDFVAVSSLSTCPSVLYSHPGVPARTMAEFIAHAKANPGKLTYATAGTGSFGHIATELLCRRAGIRMLAVPYQGASQTTTALVAGEVDVQFTLPSEAFAEYVRAGRLRALGVASPGPSPLLPGVQPIAQLLTGFEAVATTGILAPASTPPNTIALLSEAMRKALQDPSLQERFRKMGIEPAGSSSDGYRKVIVDERARWQPLIKELGMQVAA